jgi:hypothetical protein
MGIRELFYFSKNLAYLFRSHIIRNIVKPRVLLGKIENRKSKIENRKW